MENAIKQILADNYVKEEDINNFFSAMSEVLQLASENQRRANRHITADLLSEFSKDSADLEAFTKAFSA